MDRYEILEQAFEQDDILSWEDWCMVRELLSEGKRKSAGVLLTVFGGYSDKDILLAWFMASMRGHRVALLKFAGWKNILSERIVEKSLDIYDEGIRHFLVKIMDRLRDCENLEKVRLSFYLSLIALLAGGRAIHVVKGDWDVRGEELLDLLSERLGYWSELLNLRQTVLFVEEDILLGKWLGEAAELLELEDVMYGDGAADLKYTSEQYMLEIEKMQGIRTVSGLFLIERDSFGSC